jgi:hypothetical protein
MLIGEPLFAAQLQAGDGTIYNFDDPGCLLLWEAENRPQTRAAYFHHSLEDRWLARERVAFAPIDRPTPMDYGLGAVERGALPQALGPEQALSHVQTARTRKGRR